MGSTSPPPGWGAPPPPRSRFDAAPPPPRGPSGLAVGLVALGVLCAAALWLRRPTSIATAGTTLKVVAADGRQTGDRREVGRCASGRKCLVVYVAPWCGPCRSSLAGDAALADHLRSKGIETTFVVGMDQPDRCAEMVRALGRDAVIDPDGSWAKKAGVRGVPHFLVVDAVGSVTRRQAGAPGGSPPEAAGALGL
jgi:hypothetical protein